MVIEYWREVLYRQAYITLSYLILILSSQKGRFYAEDFCTFLYVHYFKELGNGQDYYGNISSFILPMYDDLHVPLNIRLFIITKLASERSCWRLGFSSMETCLIVIESTIIDALHKLIWWPASDIINFMALIHLSCTLMSSKQCVVACLVLI